MRLGSLLQRSFELRRYDQDQYATKRNASCLVDYVDHRWVMTALKVEPVDYRLSDGWAHDLVADFETRHDVAPARSTLLATTIYNHVR